MDHKQILSSLGGPHAVQADLVNRGIRVGKVCVRAWALPGRTIPAKYWTALVDIARAKDVPLAYSDLADSVAASPMQDRAA